MRIVVAYRSIPGAPGWATGDSMVRAFRRLGHEVWPYAKVYQRDEWIVPGCQWVTADKWEDARPTGFTPGSVDLLLRMECGDDETQYPELAALDCPKVYWTFDVARYPDREDSIVWKLNPDLVLTGNSKFVADGTGPKGIGGNQFVQYLPYAVDTDHFHPGNLERHGAAIIGTAFPERVDFARGAGLQLIQGQFYEDYAARLRLLQVHVHHHASGGQGLLVMRPWETMGSGTLLLTEEDETHKLHPDIPWLTYSNADDCRSKVEHLLVHETTRQKTAELQHRAVMKNHTYLHRAQSILEMVQ